MNSKDQPAGDSNLRLVFAQTGKSFLWKLAIVLAGVGAYYGLNSMESRKGIYDKARNAPIVIVDKVGAEPTETGQLRNAVELTASSVKAFFKGEQARIASANQLTPLPSPPEVKNPSALEVKFVADMEGYIDRAKYQPFKNGDELLDRLNQEILKDEAAEERVSQQQLDIIDKQYAAKQTALLTQQNESKCPAEVKAPEPTEANHARSKQENPTALEDLECDKLQEQIDSSKNDYTKQSGVVKKQFAEINLRREARVRSIYEYLRPKLLTQIEKEKGKQPIRSFAYFFPASVLDERNGIHVIYSIFWLTCMVILVFGVLFLILLVLRPLPPFAGGTEALSEQARSFLSRRSATPELAKTLIVTTAALGIGTAVAVASGMNMPTPGRDTTFEVQGSYDGRRTPEGEKPGGGPRKPEPQSSPVINVTAVAPITYPNPMTINIPSSEGPRIEALARDLGTLGGDVRTLQGNYGAIGSDLKGISGVVTQTATKVDTLEGTTTKTKAAQAELILKLGTARSDIDALQVEASSLKTDFFRRADTFNTTLQDIRNDQLRQSQPARTQNIFGITRRLFSIGSKRYLVTDQSYLLLRSMMCNKSPQPAPTASPATASTANTPAAGCILEINCKCNPDLERIFVTLKELIGREPMTEDQFMNELKSYKIFLKSWKPLILKYTRVV